MNLSKLWLYNRAFLYVMSGTGNTYRLGSWIKKILAQHRIMSDLLMIEESDFKNDFSIKPWYCSCFPLMSLYRPGP
jgi:hypothetical protein